LEEARVTAVLVTGGAGYIGSHMALALLDAGRQVVVLDDLSTGFREAVPDGATFIEGDIGDAALLARVLAEHDIEAVIHLAGFISVEESTRDPLRYYDNNTGRTRTLLSACLAAGVKRFILSSTAAVYGAPRRLPVTEACPLAPISPYGASKAMCERILADVAAAHPPLSYAILRYFNVAGADPAGRAGQRSCNATHLIKVALEAAQGRRPSVTVFGGDYATRDGTCIRDYVHVTDLVGAHLRSLEHLEDGGENLVLNVGYGRGYTVREVLRAVETAVGAPLNIVAGPPRAGDPAELVADDRLIRERLGWQPVHTDLTQIVRTALDFQASLAQRP
jgi:UDP-glucose 4-epimerase